MALRVKLDHAGIAAVLKSDEVAAAVETLAETVAAEARRHEAVQRHSIEVQTDAYETDRAAASVTLAHAAGLPVEAKHGVLTGAAGAAGLEVRSRV